MFKKILVVSLSLLISLGLAACERKGPAQKAGEKIDNAAQQVKDAVTPAGPAEKAGRKVDNAARNVRDNTSNS